MSNLNPRHKIRQAPDGEHTTLLGTEALPVSTALGESKFITAITLRSDLEPADATILKEADVVDALNSTSTTAPLSAAQGRALADGKEPVISVKGTAFNKDFGTTAGTVTEGDHVASTTGHPVATTSLPGFLSAAEKQQLDNLPAQLNRKAAEQAVVTTYAASGSSGIQVANNANINFGTGDFTLVWRGSLPDWTPSANTILAQKHDATNGWILTLLTTGILRLTINAATFDSTVAIGMTDTYSAQVSVRVVRETASVEGSVNFEINGSALGSSVAITAGAPTTVDNSVTAYVVGTSAIRSAAQTHFAATYNRALSAAEVWDLYVNGVSEADKWGSQTSIVQNPNFASSPLWWDLHGDINFTGTEAVFGPGYGQFMRNINRPNSLYKIVYTVSKAFSGTLSLRFGTEAVLDGSVGTHEIIDDCAGGFRQGFRTTGTGKLSSAKIYPLGATLALEPSGIQPAPGQWLDSSSNKLHGVLPTAGTSLKLPKRDFEVRWTNTWNNTSETQYISGLNQNILPPGAIRIDSITMRITGATGNVRVGDGSNAQRFVADVAQAAYLDCTIANRNHDGTNRKLTIAPSSAMTGSITTTVRGTILE